MNNPNWNKQPNPNADQLTADCPVEHAAAAKRVTEDELDAYRFRGILVRRKVAPVVPQPRSAPHHGITPSAPADVPQQCAANTSSAPASHPPAGAAYTCNDNNDVTISNHQQTHET